MKVGGETVQTWMIGEKTVCGSQSHFAVGDNKNSAFPVPIPACRQERTLRGQPQEAEIPTFCLRAASKALPAPLIHSWAGSMASALVVEHPGASCLTKQAAVVIKKPCTPTQIWAWLQLWLFLLTKGPSLLCGRDDEGTLTKCIRSRTALWRPRHG